jgi:hypothetical protein
MTVMVGLLGVGPNRMHILRDQLPMSRKLDKQPLAKAHRKHHVSLETELRVEVGKVVSNHPIKLHGPSHCSVHEHRRR